MQNKTASNSLAAVHGFLIALVMILVVSLPSMPATPDRGTLSATNREVVFSGGPFFADNATVLPNSVVCDPLHPCDDFTLSVNLPADYAATNPGDRIRVEVSWYDPTGIQDFDVYAISATQFVRAGLTSNNPETLVVPASGGMHTYLLRVVPAANSGQIYTAKASLVSGDAAIEAAIAAGTPRYLNYAPPPGKGETAGEPTIGFNQVTKKAMYISGLQTLRVTFPEDIVPANTTPESCAAQWDDVSYVLTKTRSYDPILFTDNFNGRNRTFVSQLNDVIAASPTGHAALIGLNSLMAYTDDDGATWTPAQINPPDSSNDHQTVGAGPYPSPIPSGINPLYPNAVYYCAQAANVLVATSFALCSRSDDGGLNFGRPTPVYLGATSGNSQMVHGHVKVAPDGTVYVPYGRRNNVQGVAVSDNAGITWTTRNVPGASSPQGAGLGDPSVGIASDNTVYFCYAGAFGGTGSQPFVSVSKDRGVTWSTPYNIGAAFGIKNAVFPSAVAGDSNRAACAFVGTTTPGDSQAATFNGTWHGYVAHTYDGGQTWTTVNATPNGPVQREACIWLQGGSNPCRNLLDFNGVTMDHKGRVLFSFADGCTGACETGGNNTYGAKATIARQSGGRGLLAAHDPAEPVAPRRPCVSGRRDDQAAYLRWNAPDNGGADIATYKIYRDDTFVGHQVGTKSSFNDRGGDNTKSHTYKVSALNSQGESLASNAITLPVGPRLSTEGACALPGVEVVSDPTGDASTTLAQHDMTSISVSEPDSMPGMIVFTMKVADLAVVPPGWRWSIRFLVPGFPPPNPAVPTIVASDWQVSMVSDGPTPSFTYGVTAIVGSPRFFFPMGNLDSRSNYNPNGTITFVLPRTAISSSPSFGPGSGISIALGSVRVSPPGAVPGTNAGNETIADQTGAGNYVLRQANLCLPNTPPQARATASTIKGVRPLTVTFDASASFDPDSIDSIASYTFNLGDGTDDVTQTSPVFTYTFNDACLCSVRIVATDSRGKVSANTYTQFVEVDFPNDPPVARLTANPLTGAAPLDVTFDASTSTDPDEIDVVGEYTFDFGDGTAPVVQSAPTVTHRYVTDGVYTASVTVKDSRGLAGALAAQQVIAVTNLLLSSISPSTICQGANDFTLTVNGNNFVAGAVVQLDGKPLATQLVNTQQLTATVPAADVATIGSRTIRVLNGDNVLSSTLALVVGADAAGPVVTPPAPVTVLQSACSGSGAGIVTAGTSSALSAFLSAGSGIDACGAATRMTAQVGGTDISDDTVFTAGNSLVTFRFQDAAGNIGTATSTVTVALFADLDGDGSVSATDLVSMANHLVGNMTAPANVSDVNRDGKVNAVDIVIIANHLVGNIGCLAN